ncbi:MAG: TIGR02099 family protein [Burkholderiales bacterium RIFCSPHIGHO2_12_FULL_67_38]|nr:MAG: TIGR02099 family protein [Burkholderiales bacterium RIFCSPLOWO2_02_FULL_67_64]OGB42935.1 MAG: TIGR02099 family protein [Burkholderiales bacterium RIFCSPHIGHO2_12_FULL_67_38]
MNHQSPADAAESPVRAPFTRSLKTLSVATRLLLWLVLAVWGLFALTLGVLHLWIVPRIGEWRPDLERWASSTVGVPVRVGAIRAEAGSAGHDWLPDFVPALVPTFELSDVRLFDAAGREALHLPSVRTALSVRSLWRLGFEQVVIASPVLDVRRTAQGHIEVAGLDLTGPDSGDHAASDWFFSQPEFVIQNGTVRWTDDLRGQPPLQLGALDFVARNQARHHRFRLDATPPPEWGERLSLRADLREPLLDLGRRAAGTARWQRWDGELFADFTRMDVSRLRAYVDLSDWGVEVLAGQGAVRAWADVKRGHVTGVTADLALRGVETRLGPELPLLALDELGGRLASQWSDAGFSFTTDNLRFRTRAGEVWPGGRLRLEHTARQGQRVAHTELSADGIELAPLSALASRLPLPGGAPGLLASLKPAGRVDGLTARWQGLPPPAASARAGSADAAAAPGEGIDWSVDAYQAKGRVVGLALAGRPSGKTSASGRYPLPGRPGIAGATVDFDLNQTGGRAHLAVANGALELPDVFEDPVLPLARFEADALWRLDGERIEAQLDNVRLANADAEGTGQARWNTSDPQHSASGSRFPGVLDVNATLTRASADRVHRYLPLTVSAEVRRYVREAVRSGRSDKVDFRIKGDMYDMPFDTPGTRGDFRIAAHLQAVDFAYVPSFLQEPGDAPWPMLKGLNGALLLDRASLRLSGLEAGLDGAPQVRLSQAKIEVANLVDHATLVVSADARGPATEMLGFVRSSPLNRMTGEALARARMTGPASAQFRLSLPFERLDATTVGGTVRFDGNDVHISPEAPLLASTTGSLSFSEKGFGVTGAQAQLYGGELRFSGGMQPDAQGVARIQFRGQGTARAEGLRDADLGFVSRLFANASGSAAYTAQLGFRAGVPELMVTSGLQGLALNLPAPLGKVAADSLPLRYENTVLSTAADASGEVARSDRLTVLLGPEQAPLAALRYERDIVGAEPRVLRGSVALGLGAGESAPLPADGVLANIQVGQINVDDWERVFTSTTGTEVRASVPGAGTATAPAPASPASDASLSYLPTTLAVRADRITVDGRSFNRVVVGGSREGTRWRANVDAEELNGYVEYGQPSGPAAGSVYARLARLNLAPSAAKDVEQILQQPSSVPALDIAVEDLVLSNRRLGRVEINAVNRAGPTRVSEWRLNRLELNVPEARLSATGNWAPDGASPGGQRRTALSFTLDINDSGLLLARFGREGVVSNGKGRIEGSIGWRGSPLAMDYASLAGQLKVDIERGQFLKVEPGAAKLLGVLSLQALPRRLVLDFRDVFSNGFAFDFVRGDARIEQGVVHTNNLQMKGVNAAVLMEGSADIAREQQDLKVVVVPEINAGTAALIATAINPAVGLGTFLAQFLLRQPLQSATTQQFHITGSWADPQVEKIGVAAVAPKSE